MRDAAPWTQVEIFEACGVRDVQHLKIEPHTIKMPLCIVR